MVESDGPGFFFFQFSDVERMGNAIHHAALGTFSFPAFSYLGCWKGGFIGARANSLTPQFEFASWGFPFLLGAIGIFIFIF
jgi:hypothetical protein